MHTLLLLRFKHVILPVVQITNCHFQCFLNKFRISLGDFNLIIVDINFNARGRTAFLLEGTCLPAFISFF